MSKTVIVLAAAAVFVATLLLTGSGKPDDPLDEQLTTEFLEFKQKFNKRYHSLSEHDFRLKTFKKNIMVIREHNRRNETSFVLGINEFTDLTFAEFSAYYLFKSVAQSRVEGPGVESPALEPKVDIDWRKMNVLPQVRNQGGLHSCSVVTTDVISATYAIFRKVSPPSLSYQEANDCVSQEKENIIYSILKYAHRNGINSFDKYPFSGKPAQCRKDLVGKGRYQIDEIGLIGPGPYNAINFVKSQPISTGMSVTKEFQFYKSGIFNPKSCPSDINHSVSIVGVHVEEEGSDRNYFVGRNSWGASWGEDGYFRIGIAPGSGVCGFTPSGWMWYSGLDY